MTEAGNSCQTWKSILSKSFPKICSRNCFESSNGPCPDFKIKLVDVNYAETPEDLTQVPEVSVPPAPYEGPVRHIVDTKSLCAKCYNREELNNCTLNDAQNATHRNNFCSTECRPLSTSLHLKEYTKRPRPKPAYKHSVFLDHETLAGRVFPVKFRIRRDKNHCLDCGKELYLRDPITDNTNVVVLRNCCDIKVYTSKYIDNWHRVPILSLTGNEVMKKRTLNEVCQLEPKKKPIEVVEAAMPSVVYIPPEPKGKKGKGKGKGKGKKK
ncbi:uncharacterized protein LOC133845565 [Drosophila sulfurigaster albostrigata]|uniref:uncharacterized protein LOC133845565 n=1 Tax=Drosophila sulfurigaster albostrigata TaxID=89887 RepID=UPI002D21C2C7|nr:uncharacterized protein LOC133845565 [Drosophila sulfurigaster albostrigata]